MHLATLYNPLIINSIRGFSGEAYINRIVPILIDFGLIICAIAFIILLIVGGIQYITSEGDKVKLEGARSKIANAITGIVILLLLWFILQILNLLFGVNIGGFGPPGYRPPAPTPTVGVPLPTPTTPPGGGWCSCDYPGVVTYDACIPPYVAECIGLFECHCVLSGAPTPTPEACVPFGGDCTRDYCCAGLCEDYSMGYCSCQNCVGSTPTPGGGNIGTCITTSVGCACECPPGYGPDPLAVCGFSVGPPLVCFGTCACIALL